MKELEEEKENVNHLEGGEVEEFSAIKTLLGEHKVAIQGGASFLADSLAQLSKAKEDLLEQSKALEVRYDVVSLPQPPSFFYYYYCF